MSKCICNSFDIQYEPKDCPFYDPEGKLRKNVEGVKMRTLHFGCPKHQGHSNRRLPTESQWYKAAQVVGTTHVQSENL